MRYKPGPGAGPPGSLLWLFHAHCSTAPRRAPRRFALPVRTRAQSSKGPESRLELSNVLVSGHVTTTGAPWPSLGGGVTAPHPHPAAVWAASPQVRVHLGATPRCCPQGAN